MNSAAHRLPDERTGLIAEPLLIFGAPRSGTSMLFQALSAHPDLWSLYRESQHVIERQMATTLQARDCDVLTAADLSAPDAAALARSFFDRVGNAEAAGQVRARLPLILRAKLSRLLTSGSGGAKPSSVRIVEKTPESSFRLPFLERLFPGARFLFVVRDPAATIASIYRGWSEPRFRTHKLPPGFEISGYRGSHWCFGQPPGWRAADGRELIDVCAFQWRAYNEFCLRDTTQLGDRVLRVRYEELCARPREVLGGIARWAGLDPRPLDRFADGLPVVNTWTRPHPEKWRSQAPQLERALPAVAEMAAALGYRTD